MTEQAAPDLHSEEKPKNWGRRTNAPYFRERYALELRAILDGMLLEYEHGTHSNKIFRYIDYPELSHNSLYLKINQSKLYLLEVLDDDKKYFRFFQLIAIKRYRNKGVVLEYAEDAKNKEHTKLHASGFSPNELTIKHPKNLTSSPIVERDSKEVGVDKSTQREPTEQVNDNAKPKEDKLPDWRITLHAFIEQGEVNQSITLKHLVLGNSDIEYIKGIIDPVAKEKSMIYKISTDKIFVARVTPEQFAQLVE